MGLPRSPEKVKLIVGLLSREAGLFEEVKKSMVRILGRIDYESPESDFIHTEYYKEEMGERLKRKFIGFERLQSLENIYRIKLKTNKIERLFAKNGRRRLNIDPGYLDLAKVVLFSTKDYIHRIYLRKGIYAETTLYYKDKSFRPWPWTYPDYATDAYVVMFNSIREQYKKNISGA